MHQRVEERARQFRDQYDRVQENVSHLSDDLTSAVRHNPGRAVLVALAAGFLVGLLFRGRHHDDD